MKKITTLLIALALLFTLTGKGIAFETGGSLIMKDTLFGTVTGAVIGAAIMAFTSEPDENLEYIAYGAASGAIAGMLFGLYEATAIVEIENGDMKIAMPTVQMSNLGTQSGSLKPSVDLFKVTF